MYLFAPVAFAMKVTALHLWSIFTPKSGANAKEREGRMHFGVAQRFAALIAGVKQTSLKLSAKASAGLPRSVRGYAGLQRGIASQCPGVCRFAAQDCLAVSRGMQACGAGCSRNVGWFRAMYRAAAVKLSWKKAKGYKVDAYEVYRANAKNGKYVKLYTTKNAKKRSFTNGRNLQAGKTYYYKVRGVRTVDGKKYYTKWSNISAKKTR